MSTKSAPASLALDPHGLEAPPHILIVDDEAFIRNAFQLYFESMGYRVSVAEGGETALTVFQNVQSAVDVVLLDLIMPGIPGIKLLQRMKEIDESVEVIIATGCGTMNSAIEALRHGAYDYITKPILNFDEDLLRVVRGAIATRTSRLKAAAGTQGVEGLPSMLDVEFYRSLEALARRVTTDPRAALDSVGKFLEKDLGILAGAAIRVSPEEVRCFARWGRAAQMEEAAIESDARVWLENIEVHRGWKVIRPSDRGFGLLEPCSRGAPLEALRMPLALFSPPGAGTSSLVLFREHGGGREHAPPDVTLLELVLSRAVFASL